MREETGAVCFAMASVYPARPPLQHAGLDAGLAAREHEVREPPMSLLPVSRRRALGLVAAPALLRATASFAQAKLLKVGVLRLASSGPVFLAQDLGFFKEAGIGVELVFFDAAQPVAVAAAAGSIDIGVTGLTAGLYNLAGKGTVALIAGQSRETKGFPLEAYLATTQPAGAALKTLADIRGRTLGITQIGSSFHYAAGLIADKFGFPIQDVKFLPLQSMGNIGTALKGGRVDAAILPATSAQSVIDGDGARLIGWGSDEVSWQVGAAFVSRRTGASPDAIAAFLAAYARAAPCITTRSTRRSRTLSRGSTTRRRRCSRSSRNIAASRSSASGAACPMWTARAGSIPPTWRGRSPGIRRAASPMSTSRSTRFSTRAS